MTITLKPVTQENWRMIISLGVIDEDQEYIESNSIILLESIYEPGCHAFGIYSDETIVGFTAYSSDTKKILINTFMIDKRFQGRGLGKEAFGQLLHHVKDRFEGVDTIELSCGNPIALHLYRSFGFQMVDDRNDKECQDCQEFVMTLKLI